jgi:glycosyltransferase involved in cell wall biosynthesis
VNDRPKISVITPCLNAAATIDATIESVRSQRYPHVQHIVIDGGSTDGTLERIRTHPEIQLVSEPDEGLSDALNKGLRLAVGDLIGWLNADDVYLEGALDAVAEAHLANPELAWVTGHCRIIGNDAEEIRPIVTRYKSALLRRYRYWTLLTQNYVSAPATFLTKDCLSAIGQARIDQRFAMDYDLWLRAGRVSRPAIVDREIAGFRMVEGTLSMTSFEAQFREHAHIAWSHARGAERVAAAANRVMSRLIVFVYRLLARRRGAARLSS